MLEASPVFKTPSCSHLPANNCHNWSHTHLQQDWNSFHSRFSPCQNPTFSNTSVWASINWEQDCSKLSPKPGLEIFAHLATYSFGLDFAKELDEVNTSSFLQFHLIFQAGNTGKEDWNASSGPRKTITHQFYNAGKHGWAQRITNRLEIVTFLQGKGRLQREMAYVWTILGGGWESEGRSNRDSSKHCINTN